MFPTPVGMNRYPPMFSHAPTDVPHTRGDEPIKQALDALEA